MKPEWTDPAMLQPSLRNIAEPDQTYLCSECGAPAVQEVTVGRDVKTTHYFCLKHAVVLADNT